MASPDGGICGAQGLPTGAPCQSKEDIGWRRVVRNFTPSWFSVNMGTGIVSILLHQLPYTAPPIFYISYVFFGLNVVLFIIFTALTTVRYVLYPEIWPAMIAHAGQSLFLGCFPMGFATIINMMALACTSWGRGFIYLTWSFWWVDVVLSVAVCISMPYIVMSRHKPELQTVTAAMLLTVVPAVVAAGTGSLIADILPNTGHAFATLAVSYVLWGIGVLFTGCILALYFQRLTLHSLPAKEVIVSVFLPLGPMGQGGFGAQELGKVAITILPETTAFRPLGLGTAQSGEILYVMGVFLGLVMWGFGMVWLAIALISIRTTKDFPFNMGWWGFTFPLGTMAACSGSLATNLDSDFFKVATMILTSSVVLLWIVVAARTVHLSFTGALFYAPCLKDLREKEQVTCSGLDRP